MWIGCAAASAAAQDRDPFDAVLEAQRVREKQMVQVRRADSRIVNPMHGDPLPPTRHAPAGTPIDLPRERGPGEGRAPWLLGVVALGAIVGFVMWRRSRRTDWSRLPGHQGLRRK